MDTGAITGYVDVAQIVLYGFWIFFAALIIYLRREDKREGYPLESDRSDSIKVQGFPAVPEPKKFELPDGRVVYAPRQEEPETVANAQPSEPWPGAPLEPVGDPMLAGVGPGSAARRPDHPEEGPDGLPKIRPLRACPEFSVANGQPDPRRMTVVGADGEPAGAISDAWIDLEEPQIRYLEAQLNASIAGGDNRPVLIPMPLAKINARRETVTVNSLTASQFAHIPRISSGDSITLQEEENVVAYFGAGQLYAMQSRKGPLV